MGPRLRDAMQIFVKSVTGKTIAIQAEVSSPIAALKAKIQRRLGMQGIRSDQHRLLCGGKLLQEGRTLAQYRVRKGATLHLMPVLRGGMLNASTGRWDMYSIFGVASYFCCYFHTSMFRALVEID